MDYDIKLNQLRTLHDANIRDNFEIIKESLVKIQEILDDINNRLEVLETT